MAYLIGSADTARFSSTVTPAYGGNANVLVTSGNDTEGLTASATGLAGSISISVNNWLSATNLKLCLYDENVLVETVVVPSSAGTGVITAALAGTTTITSGNKYRLAIYSEGGENVTLDSDTSGLTLRAYSSSGSYTTPVDPLPAGNFLSFNEFYFAVEEAGPSFSITDIDGDNDVQAGQTGAIITTSGIDPASVTQATTLGGETITINTWS